MDLEIARSRSGSRLRQRRVIDALELVVGACFTLERAFLRDCTEKLGGRGWLTGEGRQRNFGGSLGGVAGVFLP